MNKEKMLIAYSSATGNTKYLADSIHKYYDEAELINLKENNDVNVDDFDLICVGFWVDKGTSDEYVNEFLKKLYNKKVFLFGTAGFGSSEEYFNSIIKRVKTNLDDSNKCVSYFMCQGRMPNLVKDKYLLMLKNNPNDAKIKLFLDNFDKALNHPNEEDSNRLIEKIKKIK